MHKYNYRVLLTAVLLLFVNGARLKAQSLSSETPWIRPVNEKSPPVWGIRNGIVFGLWPAAIEAANGEYGGGPRGLIRLGYEYKGRTYHINFLAIEPIIGGKMEFSEISPSGLDHKWGKLMWAGNSPEPGDYYPAAKTTGEISHPDPSHPEIEELTVYVFMERFTNGAHPFLKLSIRNDRPEELCTEIFSEEDSGPIEQCGITATMGNYSRLRMLYLKDRIADSRVLYRKFDGIGFIEKEEYPAKDLLKDRSGDFIAIASSNEPFAELSSWPEGQKYLDSWSWRYRPFFKLTQYWRKEHAKYDPSLRVRVNGRAKYWGGGSNDVRKYIDIPGGPAYENFELREKYYEGQKFYFGITRKTAEELVPEIKYSK